MRFSIVGTILCILMLCGATVPASASETTPSEQGEVEQQSRSSRHSKKSCKRLYNEIMNMTFRDKRPHGDKGTHGLLERIEDFYRYGTQSTYKWGNHRKEFFKTRKGLRARIDAWDQKGCGPPPGPNGIQLAMGLDQARQAAQAKVPTKSEVLSYRAQHGTLGALNAYTLQFPGAQKQGNELADDVKVGLGLGALAYGVWMGAKILSPACGPFAPFCAVVLSRDEAE